MNYIVKFIIIGMVILAIAPSCRQKFNATEIDMADYGWILYEDRDFLESNRWFSNSIIEDSSYKDGYNGLGWSFGKLMELDSSTYYFLQGLSHPENPYITIVVEDELKAGLCFAYNAKGTDSLAIEWGNQLLDDIDQLDIPTWKFSHDTTLNHLDVQLTLALSNYNVGDFTQSLSHIQTIVDVLSPGQTFTAATNTTEGRRDLIDQIERLQIMLESP